MKIFAAIILVSTLHFFVFSHFATAQSDDYIILKDGSKVYGKIEKKFDYESYDKIRFSKPVEKPKTLFPSDIGGFGFENGWQYLVKKLAEEKEPEFVQVLISGKLTLLRSQNIFYIDNGTDIIELVAHYEEESINGREFSDFKRPYIATLNMLMAGNCTNELYQDIFNLKYEEYGFISVLSKYHLCENLPFELHFKKEPFTRISPVISAGMSSIVLTPSTISGNRKDAFETSIFPIFQIGVKAHQFRKWPRLSMDVSIAYLRQDNTVLSEYVSTEQYMTATENYAASTIMVPVTINYTWIRMGNVDSYIGLGVVSNYNKIESEFSIIDQTLNSTGITTLYEEPLTDIKRRFVSPVAKLGSVINLSKKLALIAEFQITQNSEVMSVSLPFNVVIYDRMVSSLLIGLRF
ncbi:hypothetical protein [Aquiflexum gelatinilyticum]|uniref:hypothetical protein n=1 Tax=Aquiflexum gelatinilyticum TaxID=2961943 RepID=UPI0021685B24|nr:hypothetical protein [Aquiflexum gelatinilyticum]MCS4434295.1 hypothetical protein [Aquiflexum gelatinilyticum]